jgi:hypothetical protein
VCLYLIVFCGKIGVHRKPLNSLFIAFWCAPVLAFFGDKTVKKWTFVVIFCLTPSCLLKKALTQRTFEGAQIELFKMFSELALCAVIDLPRAMLFRAMYVGHAVFPLFG